MSVGPAANPVRHASPVRYGMGRAVIWCNRPYMVTADFDDAGKIVSAAVRGTGQGSDLVLRRAATHIAARLASGNSLIEIARRPTHLVGVPFLLSILVDLEDQAGPIIRMGKED